MPILAMSSGTVTAVWGAAFVRLPSGKLKPIQVGDKMKGGEHILTEADGIVQISPNKGPSLLVKAPPLDIDQDPPAAGPNGGGADGSLQEGLRVERDVESVTQLAFNFGTERTPPTTPVELGNNMQLFPATVVQVLPVEPATVSLSGPVSVNEAVGTVTYIVTLSRVSDTPVTVKYGTQDGSATGGNDYTPASGTLTFAPGETSKTITVDVVNDRVYEGAETYTVSLSDVNGAALGTPAVTTTIRDDGTGELPPGTTADDDRPYLVVVGEAAVEGAPVGFFVQLTHPSTEAVTVKLALQNGVNDAATPENESAAAGVDTTGPLQYEASPGVWADVPANGVLTFAPEQTEIHVRVATVDDNIVEPTEYIKLQATVISGTTVNKEHANQAAIDDNDGVVQVAITGPAEVNEAAGTISYTVTLSAPSSETVKVDFSTVDGSAKSGSDFTAQAGTLTFAPGQTTQVITVPISNDGVYEGSESYQVTISNAVGGVITTAAVTTAIKDDGTGSLPNGGSPDDDRPHVSAVSSPKVTEGGNLDFAVKLTHASTTDTLVTLKLSSGTGTVGTDTQAPLVSFDGGKTFVGLMPAADGSVVITVPAGTPVDQVVVRVPTSPDAVFEGDETIKLSAATPHNATPAEGTGTIVDDEVQPTLAISGPADVNEAAGLVTYTVTLSGASGSSVTVAYKTQDGTALAGDDFSTSAGTLTFAPGETTKTITVAITEDRVYEGAQDYSVKLSDPVGATITTPLASTIIHDDGSGVVPPVDSTPHVSAVSSPTTTEGDALVFKVDLSNPSASEQPLKLQLSDGTAKLGEDTGTPVQVSFDGGQTYQTITVKPDGSADVTVPAGATSVLVKVPTVDDTSHEPTETLKLSASLPGTAPVEGTGSITDNDATPKVSISGPVEVNEAAGTVTYTVKLSNASSETVKVNYGSDDGTATSGKDYGATQGSLSFAPGETEKTVTVSIIDDKVLEGAETYKISLSAPTGAVIDVGSVTTTIKDDGTGSMPNGGTPTDDTPKVASVSATPVVEGEPLVFKVDLSNPSTTPTPLTFW